MQLLCLLRFLQRLLFVVCSKNHIGGVFKCRIPMPIPSLLISSFEESEFWEYTFLSFSTSESFRTQFIDRNLIIVGSPTRFFMMSLQSSQFNLTSLSSQNTHTFSKCASFSHIFFAFDPVPSLVIVFILSLRYDLATFYSFFKSQVHITSSVKSSLFYQGACFLMFVPCTSTTML